MATNIPWVKESNVVHTRWWFPMYEIFNYKPNIVVSRTRHDKTCLLFLGIVIEMMQFTGLEENVGEKNIELSLIDHNFIFCMNDNMQIKFFWVILTDNFCWQAYAKKHYHTSPQLLFGRYSPCDFTWWVCQLYEF